jgi:hypothetical protein
MAKTVCDDPSGGRGEGLTRNPTGLVPLVRPVGSSHGYRCEDPPMVVAARV